MQELRNLLLCTLLTVSLQALGTDRHLLRLDDMINFGASKAKIVSKLPGIGGFDLVPMLQVLWEGPLDQVGSEESFVVGPQQPSRLVVSSEEQNDDCEQMDVQFIFNSFLKLVLWLSDFLHHVPEARIKCL